MPKEQVFHELAERHHHEGNRRVGIVLAFEMAVILGNLGHLDVRERPVAGERDEPSDQVGIRPDRVAGVFAHTPLRELRQTLLKR